MNEDVTNTILGLMFILGGVFLFAYISPHQHANEGNLDWQVVGKAKVSRDSETFRTGNLISPEHVHQKDLGVSPTRLVQQETKRKKKDTTYSSGKRQNDTTPSNLAGNHVPSYSSSVESPRINHNKAPTRIRQFPVAQANLTGQENRQRARSVVAKNAKPAKQTLPTMKRRVPTTANTPQRVASLPSSSVVDKTTEVGRKKANSNPAKHKSMPVEMLVAKSRSITNSGWKKNPWYIKQNEVNESVNWEATRSNKPVPKPTSARNKNMRLAGAPTQTVSDQAVSDQAVSDQAVSDQAVSDQAVSVAENSVIPASYESESESESRPIHAKPILETKVTSGSHNTRLRQRILTSTPAAEAKAMERVHYGKSLARRGAFFAAREEFLNAMYFIAESYDRRSGNSSHSKHLKRALLALEEVKDFERINRNHNSTQSLQFILSAHNSKLIDPNQVGRFTREQLIAAYCQHAGSQLELALGKSPAASQSLFAFGKLLTAKQEQEVLGSRVSWTVFLVAFAADPLNDENANEIGVRLLQSGQLLKAKDMFLKAVQASNSAIYWNNLAEAHLRLAQAAKLPRERNSHLIFADQAKQQAKIAPSKQSQESTGSGWVSMQQFQEDAAVPDSRLGSPQNNEVSPGNSSRANTRSANAENGPQFLKKLKNWF